MSFVSSDLCEVSGSWFCTDTSSQIEEFTLFDALKVSRLLAFVVGNQPAFRVALGTEGVAVVFELGSNKGELAIRTLD